jgi:putative membrane protein
MAARTEDGPPQRRKEVRVKRSFVAAVGSVLAVLVSAVAASAGTHGSLSAQDANYLQTSISGDRFEIIGGKMALQKQMTRQVRVLAIRLIKDHSKSLRESVAEAKKYGIDVPKSPTPSEVWELQTVSGFSGLSFDRAYSRLEVKDHQQDIEETTFEVVHGGNSEIKQSAQKELPMLRLHLALSKRAMTTA